MFMSRMRARHSPTLRFLFLPVDAAQEQGAWLRGQSSPHPVTGESRCGAGRDSSGDQSIRRPQLRLLLGGCRNLLHGRLVVGVVYGTKPWRRSPALLLRLIQPRATCTLFVHSPPFDLSVWWFLSLQTAVGMMSLRHRTRTFGRPPGCTDRYKNNILAFPKGHVKPPRRK